MEQQFYFHYLWKQFWYLPVVFLLRDHDTMSWKQSFSTRQPTFSSSAQDLLFESDEENNDPFAEEVETQLDPDFVAPIVV